jgi:hypothetical protein
MAWTTVAAAPPDFEVSGFAGYRIGGEFDVDPSTAESEETELDDGESWGVGLALYRDRSSFYELLYSRQSTDLDRNEPALADVNITTEYYQFGGTLLFEPQRGLEPYFSLTIGLTHFEADGYGSETEFSGSVGGGLRIPLGQRASVVLGVRAYGTLVDSDTGLFCSTVNGEATCLLRSSGDVVFQGEATAGLAFRF